MTKIEWTHRPGTKGESWNPIRAHPRGSPAFRRGWHCEHVTEACRFCYAEGLNRFRGTAYAYARQNRDKVEIDLDDKALADPLRWRAPRTVFVCSMTDLFGDWVTDEWLDRIFAVMALCPQHTFLVLTKRPARARAYLSQFTLDGRYVRSTSRQNTDDRRDGNKFFLLERGQSWPLANCWLGVSVHDQESADEFVPILLDTPAAKRWVSYEPALGPVNFRGHLLDFHSNPGKCANCGRGHGFTRCPNTGGVALTRSSSGAGDPGCDQFRRAEFGIDWIIVGGESGPKARPFDLAWARSTIAQGKAAGVPAFVKQLGARPVDGCGNDEPDFIAKCDCGALPIEVRDRKGGDPSEWPEDLRVREWPA